MITDKTSFFQLAQQFINKDKVLSVEDPSHIMALAVDNQKILKIFEIDNSIYGQKQLLNKAQLIYYDVGVPYAQLVENQGYQIVEIRTYAYGSSKSSIASPKLLIIDPSKYSVRDLQELVFKQNLSYLIDYFESTDQNLLSQYEYKLKNAIQNDIKYSDVFNEETGEALIPGIYQLGIAQTIVKKNSLFSSSYYCQLTGQKKVDQYIGVQLKSLKSSAKIQQIVIKLKKSTIGPKRLILNSVWPQKSKIIKPKLSSCQRQAHSYDFIKQKSSARSDLTLQNCLSAFRCQEVLDGQDKWYCSRCKQHQRALKKMDLFKLPKILIIQLKRFKQKGRASYFWGPTCEKNSKLISFPLENLDLSEYVIEGSPHYGNKADSLYDLYGVVHHMGSLYGGHYIATAKNFLDDSWYTYDDSHVSQCRSKSEVISSSAYVLFYKKKNIKLD